VPSLLLAALVLSAHARALQPGELVVFSIRAPAAADAVALTAFSRRIPAFRVDATHWRALVGIDLETAPGVYTIEADATSAGVAQEHASYELAVHARRFPTRQLHVDEAFVNPPASVEQRIEKEAAELDAIWQTSTTQRLWSVPFVRPVSGPANSQFGSRSIFNGVPRAPHGGGDFLSPAGTPVKSPNAGRVVVARSLYFSGNTVIVDHGLGLYSLLAHLSEIDVHEGDSVDAGEVIGKVGATGRVTGPHLHWAVRANGARVDPLSLLAVVGRRKP
jgi:murein DD-endopeptidase MepM/ murein hydrolase activator NlpD